MKPDPMLEGYRILITGGTGSFGRSMARRLLTSDNPPQVVIFSRDEWKQWEMRKSDPVFDHSNIRYFLGDVRDESRLRRAFHEVDYVIHAAALKQVPAAEYNPTEFVNTNVMGAMNIINAALDTGVEKVIALSTDKAVNPINLYGATKLCSDKLFISGNVYAGPHAYPRFAVVRYGNVIGSRGSIIPFWKQMIQEGAESLPVTDERMTRFWITLERAVSFVLECFRQMRGGEIYVPKIPSMKIVDLAQAVAPDLPRHVIGIREGEKLHELLISSEQASQALEYDDHYVLVPQTFRNRPEALERFLEGRPGKPVPEDFVYSSDTNPHFLAAEEIQEQL